MWPADLAEHSIRRIRELRPDITVESFADMPKPPKPHGFKLTMPGGGVVWVQATTTAPPGGGASQSAWE